MNLALSDLPAPAQLWLGPHDKLSTEVYTYCQVIWCDAGGCQLCTVCSQIINRRYHQIVWLKPEKAHYTLGQLELVFKQLSFALNSHELFMFVFEYADALSPLCASSLLKSLRNR